MPKIVNRFTTDTALNDALAHRFVCLVLNKQMTVYDKLVFYFFTYINSATKVYCS